MNLNSIGIALCLAAATASFSFSYAGDHRKASRDTRHAESAMQLVAVDARAGEPGPWVAIFQRPCGGTERS